MEFRVWQCATQCPLLNHELLVYSVFTLLAIISQDRLSHESVRNPSVLVLTVGWSSLLQVSSKDYSWFPYDNVLDNLLHTVTTVTISSDSGDLFGAKSNIEEETMNVEEEEEVEVVEDMFHLSRPKLDSRQG